MRWLAMALEVCGGSGASSCAAAALRDASSCAASLLTRSTHGSRCDEDAEGKIFTGVCTATTENTATGSHGLSPSDPDGRNYHLCLH